MAWQEASVRLFHGTSTVCLDAIASEGITPRPVHDNPERICVYLAATEDLAAMYAGLACQRRGGEPVVLEIDPDQLEDGCLEPDDFELQHYIDDLHDPDRGGDIGMLSGMEVDERLLPFRSWHEVPPDVSLAVTGQVAYVATIPVEALVAGLPDRDTRPKA